LRRGTASHRGAIPHALAAVLERARSNPRDAAAAFVAAAAVAAVVVNALWLQPGPHPAPMFSLRPPPVADGPTGTVADLPGPRPAEAGVAASDAGTRSRADLVSDVQRELAQRGFYDGAVDGAFGAKTDLAIRDFEQANGLKSTGEPTPVLLQAIRSSPGRMAVAVPKPNPRKDPIAELLAPSRQLTAIQRALSEFGYGQVTPNGMFGPDTRAAIERFERDRKMPVTGQVSDRLVRELSAMTGRPL